MAQAVQNPAVMLTDLVIDSVSFVTSYPPDHREAAILTVQRNAAWVIGNLLDRSMAIVGRIVAWYFESMWINNEDPDGVAKIPREELLEILLTLYEHPDLCFTLVSLIGVEAGQELPTLSTVVMAGRSLIEFLEIDPTLSVVPPGLLSHFERRCILRERVSGEAVVEVHRAMKRALHEAPSNEQRQAVLDLVNRDNATWTTCWYKREALIAELGL